MFFDPFFDNFRNIAVDNIFTGIPNLFHTFPNNQLGELVAHIVHYSQNFITHFLVAFSVAKYVLYTQNDLLSTADFQECINSDAPLSEDFGVMSDANLSTLDCLVNATLFSPKIALRGVDQGNVSFQYRVHSSIICPKRFIVNRG